jgi:hypothetical protein
MFYRKNVGSKESVVRVVGGVLMAAGSLALVGTTPLGLLLAASGGGLVLSGLLGYCPACALVGRKPVEPGS